MNRLVESTYYRAPVFLQNLLVSAYGLKLYRQRYGARAGVYLHELLASERLPPADMREFQRQRFVAMARHAIRTTPFYRDWARVRGFRPEDVTSLDHLREFPVLEKQAIQEAPEQFISDHLPRSRLIEIGTSGTTGSPLRIFTDRNSRTHHYAFWSRLRGWYGLGPRSSRATLFGRVIMPASSDRPPFWRYDAAQRNLLLSSYHLAPANLPAYYRKLTSFQPSEIVGYPSSIYRIAMHILENDLPRLAPRVVITTAETLLDYQREAISKAFDAPLCDQYGCAEMAFFASQCPNGAMHFHPEHSVNEVVVPGGDGNPAGADESGELLATGLVNWAMPLIRYRVGDSLSVTADICDCGRPFPVISSLQGRLDDVVVSPRTGRPVGRLGPVFRADKAVREAQVYQDAFGRIEIRIIPMSCFSAEHEQRIVKDVMRRVGGDVDIKVRLVDEIPRSANGKFRAVISDYRIDGEH